MRSPLLSTLLLAALAGSASAATTYHVDPGHTYPSFEVDHMGLSLWRGKFDKTSGSITLDRAGKTGTVDITIQTGSINFGLDKMNSRVQEADMFNAEKFPTIRYVSKRISYNGDQPASIEGEMTLLGVTRPLTLTLDRFKCIVHPRYKREVCGANAVGEFKRSDFGLSYGVPNYAPEVKLAIQVEAIQAD
jgi:polyisoprenoid-binding protein YceI